MKSRLDGLDQLRGIAALLVLGYHLWTEFGVMPIFSRSYLAVDFFFLLSGFVMARTYETTLVSRELSAGGFLRIRFHRLWAPMAAGTLAGFGLWLTINPAIGLIALVPALALLPNLWLPRPYLLNRPAWSIFFELFANAVHGLVLWRASIEVLLAIACASGLFLLVYCIPLEGLHVGFRSQDFLAGIPRVLLPYCLGIALFRLDRQLPSQAGAAAVCLAAGLTLLPKGLVWDLIFVAAICPALVAFGQRGARKFGRWLGRLSFPLYAVHFPILEICKQIDLSPAIAAASALAGAALVAKFADHHKHFALTLDDRARLGASRFGFSMFRKRK